MNAYALKKITATTSDHAIENATKDELAKVMIYSPKSKKSEMVIEAKALRDELKQEAAEQAAQEEEARLQQLAKDKENPAVKQTFAKIAERLAEIVEEQTTTVEKFRKGVAEAEVASLLYALDHGRMESAMYASAKLYELNHLHTWVSGQLAEQTITIDQFIDMVEEDCNRQVTRVMESDEFVCNSTSSVARLNGPAAYAAQKFVANLISNIVKWLNSEDCPNGSTYYINGDRLH